LMLSLVHDRLSTLRDHWPTHHLLLIVVNIGKKLLLESCFGPIVRRYGISYDFEIDYG
jgi:hypothetical protein